VLKIFTGWDQREAAGWHAFAQSVIERTSIPVAITPLNIIGPQRDGSNAFTYTRFLIPELCNFAGFALYADGADMIALGDLAELWEMRSKDFAVQVVKHDYATKHARKYLGTEMEVANADYPRKNWSSLVLWNCGHQAHFDNREKLRSAPGSYLHRFSWLKDEQIGELPAAWNWIPEEQGVNAGAKILHFSIGIPGIWAHRNAPHAQEWHGFNDRAAEVPAERRIAEVASQR
jgi:hypothetical protein